RRPSIDDRAAFRGAEKGAPGSDDAAVPALCQVVRKQTAVHRRGAGTVGVIPAIGDRTAKGRAAPVAADDLIAAERAVVDREGSAVVIADASAIAGAGDPTLGYVVDQDIVVERQGAAEVQDASPTRARS